MLINIDLLINDVCRDYFHCDPSQLQVEPLQEGSSANVVFRLCVEQQRVMMKCF